MPYSPLHLSNLTELKLRVGNITDTVIATILGLDYPNTEGFSVYVWNNNSLAIADDNEVVCPNSRLGQAGRWIKINLLALLFELDPIWISEKINYLTISESDLRYLQSFTETDPTVPNFVKAITTSNINNWNTAFSWGDNNTKGYLTENSHSNLTNKTGNISQWSNDSGYITGITSSQIINSLGYTPYNSTNPNGYVTLSSVTWSNIPDKPTLFTGNYNDLTNKPTIPTNTNQLTNGSGYITGVTSLNITTALGYTPYNATNPNGYITGVTSSQIISGLGYTPYNSTNPNGYINQGNVTWSNIPDKPIIPPAQINSDWNSISGLSQILNKPIIPTNTNQLLNGNGFITGITSSQIINSLGYTPYNSTNPNGYITLSSVTWSNIPDKPTIPTNTNQLTNGSGYITLNNISGGTGISYNSATGVITNSLPDLTVTLSGTNGITITGTYPNFVINAATPIYNNAPARTVTTGGTAYQVSTNRNSRVSYTVTLTTSVALLNLNSSAQVFLEISSNNSTWTTINSAGLNRTLVVAIAVGVNESSIYNIQGEVPAGYYVRLRSVLSGGGTAVLTSGQEVIY